MSSPTPISCESSKTALRRRARLFAHGALLTTAALAVASFLFINFDRLPALPMFDGAKTEKTENETSRAIPSTILTNNPVKSTAVLPQACQAYVTDSEGGGKGTLHLKHGRYIHIPGRPPPYDQNSCFLMKPRYNCATSSNESSSLTEAYEWKFILQSDRTNESTICDIHQVVKDFGGPAAFRDTKVGLFGDSMLRQVFEALACTYQMDLTKSLVNQNPPANTMAAIRKRKGKPYSKSEVGTIVSVPLNKRPIPHCSGKATEFAKHFRPGVPLTTEHLTDSCSDDLAMMEYNHSFQIYYNFHPERVQDTAETFQEVIGLNVSNLDRVFAMRGVWEHFESLGASISASHVNVSSVIPFLKERLKRDVGEWLGATNPWITGGKRDPTHPCLPGMPDDEAAILLFSIMFDIHNFDVE